MMTPDEWSDMVVDSRRWEKIEYTQDPDGNSFPLYSVDESRLRQLIRDAVRDAVTIERQACAKVARDDLGSDAYLGGYSVQDLQRFAAERIEKAILARK